MLSLHPSAEKKKKHGAAIGIKGWEHTTEFKGGSPMQQSYKYAVVGPENAVELQTQVSPDVFAQHLEKIFQVVGVKPNFAVYLQRQDGGPYEGVYGTDPRVLSLFPLAPNKPSMTKQETLKLGEAITTSYQNLRTKYLRYLRQNRSSNTTHPDNIVKAHKWITMIEESVAVKENLRSVFEMAIKKHYAPDKCALQEYVSLRTWYRRVEQLKIHLAYDISHKLTNAELHQLLDEGQDNLERSGL